MSNHRSFRQGLNVALAILFNLGLPVALIYFGVIRRIAILFGAGIVSLVLYFYRDSRGNQRLLNAECRHGVKGGGRGACNSCFREAELEQDKRRLEDEKRRQQKLIRDRALVLRDKEIKRLSAAWLTEGGAYLTMSPQQFEDAIAELFKRL